jgi:hypothetical protein
VTDASGNLQWRAVPGFDPDEPVLTALAIRQPGLDDTSELSACADGDVVPPSVLLITEVDSNQGSLDRQFVELLFRGAGALSLAGRVVVFYDGETDASYAAFDLDGFSTDGEGRFVLGNEDTPGVDLVFDDGLLQDGPDAVALHVGDAAAFPDGTPVTTANLLDAVVYGIGDVADDGLLALLGPGQPQLDEAAGGNASAHSLQRCPEGAGNGRETDTFAPAPPTPDDTNQCVTCLLSPFDGIPHPDHTVTADVRANRVDPLAGATVFFEVVAGPSAGAQSAAITDAQGRAGFTFDRDANACGMDTIAAAGSVNGTPFLCRSMACGNCPAVGDLVLDSNDFPGTVVHEACGSISAGDSFVVAPGDDVTFRAPTVILRPGFAVAVGGKLAAGRDTVP